MDQLGQLITCPLIVFLKSREDFDVEFVKFHGLTVRASRAITSLEIRNIPAWTAGAGNEGAGRTQGRATQLFHVVAHMGMTSMTKIRRFGQYMRNLVTIAALIANSQQTGRLVSLG